MNIFENKNRLWWFGLFLVDFGLGLWILSIFPKLMIFCLDFLITSDLNSLSTIGVNSFQFGLGISGAITTGWGLTIMATSFNLTTAMRNYLVIGIIVWYVMDGIISYLTMFYANILSNTFLLIIAIFVLYTTQLNE